MLARDILTRAREQYKNHNSSLFDKDLPPLDCLTGKDNEKHALPANSKELPQKATDFEQSKSLPNSTLMPQSDVYVQKSTEHQNDSLAKNLPSQFDSATSPVTCDFSDDGDRPVQRKIINFQPLNPVGKSSTTTSNDDPHCSIPKEATSHVNTQAR